MPLFPTEERGPNTLTSKQSRHPKVWLSRSDELRRGLCLSERRTINTRILRICMVSINLNCYRSKSFQA